MGGQVEVGAEEKVELATTQHEVETEVGGSLEICIDGGKEGEIERVVPELADDRWGTGLDTVGNSFEYVEFNGGKKVKATGRK